MMRVAHHRCHVRPCAGAGRAGKEIVSTYFRPETLDAAIALLAQGGTTIAAGCTDLLAATQAHALRGRIVDITRIPGLRGIAQTDDHLRIGATTTWGDILAAELPPCLDMLGQAAREVGGVQIQNAGTIAGNICNASPAADGVPCLLALDARVETMSAGGMRVLPLADFVTGPRRTALRADEIVTALLVPRAAMAGTSGFLKLGARRYLVISIVMVAARVVIRKGRIAEAAIAVGACGPTATRLSALEAALCGQPADSACLRLATPTAIAPALAPIADVRGSAGYRVEAAAELIRRCLSGLMTKERSETA